MALEIQLWLQSSHSRLKPSYFGHIHSKTSPFEKSLGPRTTSSKMDGLVMLAMGPSWGVLKDHDGDRSSWRTSRWLTLT